MTFRASMWWLAGALIGVLILVGLVTLLFGFRKAPASNSFVRDMPWPVACTTRGCITAREWTKQHERVMTFAAFNHQAAMHFDDSLTTLIRQHLVHEALKVSPVSFEDARRYREDVLKMTDGNIIQETTGLTEDEYDQIVLVPFLEQEALRQQMRVESLDELYVQLSRQRRVWIPMSGMWWDTDTGRVARRL